LGWHGENGPSHGWVGGFQASDLSLQKVFNTSPNGSASGIWESGGGLGVDAAGNLYFATGNGFGVGFSPGGPASLGGGGGGLGYQGIGQSVAVTFREFTSSQIGLGVNGSFQGQVPTTGIDFNAAAQATPRHTFRATVTYDGTNLGAMITDLTTNVTSTAPSQAVNIPQVVGASTAWVGFTGGTGGLNVQQDVQTWTYTPGSGPGIDHAAGFASNGDLQANGSASFTGTVARVTTAQ